jgi:hypothetical protein
MKESELKVGDIFKGIDWPEYTPYNKVIFVTEKSIVLRVMDEWENELLWPKANSDYDGFYLKRDNK